ncbi:MAG: DUF4446 family protein [Lachnospiraceae bacterium]|nr:DUF4446 family protein [Lachnospiraceae bacterium]
MESAVLNAIGLGNVDIGYLLIGFAAVIVLLLILIIVQAVNISNLKKKYLKFMKGKNAGNLEEKIMTLLEDNRYLRAATEKSKGDIKDIYKQLTGCYQKVGLVKYDAFNQMGGKLSFSLALLNEKDNGFILNSVHSTEGGYSYIKEIKNGKSVILLGEEEQQALNQAMGIE